MEVYIGFRLMIGVFIGEYSLTLFFFYWVYIHVRFGLSLSFQAAVFRFDALAKKFFAKPWFPGPIERFYNKLVSLHKDYFDFFGVSD